MRLIIKGLGIFQILSGLLIIISLLYNLITFINNFNVFNLILFLGIILIYINAGWMMLYYSKIGIMLSIFIQLLQITVLPGLKYFHNIMLAPGLYLTWNNSFNIRYPVSIASFSIYNNYYQQINLTSLLLIIIFSTFLIVELFKRNTVLKNINDIY